jgi:hypothetical protein
MTFQKYYARDYYAVLSKIVCAKLSVIKYRLAIKPANIVVTLSFKMAVTKTVRMRYAPLFVTFKLF